MDQKTIRGDLTACLQHLVAQYRTDAQQKARLYEVLSSFVKCRTEILRTWVSGAVTPRKNEYIRLAAYLECLGYKITEREDMLAIVNRASHVFAFCNLSIEDVADLVGFTASESAHKHTSLILRGIRTPGSQTTSRFESLVDLYEDDLKIKIQEVALPPGWGRKTPNWLKPQEKKPVVQEVETTAAPEVSETDACVRIDKQQIIQTLAHGILTLRPLAQMVRSDQFTAEERAKLRELTGGDGVFELTNLLSALCSEHSRNIR